jgi:hypothetical protein
MVNSTGVSATVNDSDNIRKYYTIFINTMSTIARSFGAKIVKNITDGLIMYFPKTSNSIDDTAFKDVIECGSTMLAAGNVISTKLTEQKLAAVTYRISADYGKVEVAKVKTSQQSCCYHFVADCYRCVFSCIILVTSQLTAATIMFSPAFNCYPLLSQGLNCARTMHVFVIYSMQIPGTATFLKR